MAKRGAKSFMKTFIQVSAVISENTPELGLNRLAEDNEIKRAVLVRVLPLSWIHSIGGSEAELFNFFSAEIEKLQGSLLLDAVFTSFWKKKKSEIMRYIFYPYIFYFFVAIFYYYECLLIGVGRSVGIVREICPFIYPDSIDDCEVGETIEPYVRYIFLFLVIY